MSQDTERFKSPIASPVGLPRELLETLAEEYAEIIKECAEGIQRVTKALRFGLAEIQPGQDLTNQERIALEIGDLFAVVDRLEAMNIINPEFIMKGIAAKNIQLIKFLQNDG